MLPLRVLTCRLALFLFTIIVSGFLSRRHPLFIFNVLPVDFLLCHFFIYFEPLFELLYISLRYIRVSFFLCASSLVLMSIPIPVPRLGAGHDLLNAVGVLVTTFDIGKEASFLLPDNLKTHYCLLNGSQLKHNNLVAVLHTNVDGSFCVNFVGQVTMIGPDFVSFYHVTATHNPAIPLAFRSPVVGASNVLFVVAHTLGVEWAVDNSGGGQVFNFKDGDATVLEAALEVKTASIASVSSVSATALLSAADTAKQHGFLKKTLFDDRVRFDELAIANCPLGRQLTSAVIDGLDTDSDMHNRFVLYPSVLQRYILLEIAKGSSNLHPPLTPQAKFEGPVDLLWLSKSFEITAPVVEPLQGPKMLYTIYGGS